MKLTDNQIKCLKVLKRAPKTTAQACSQLVKTMSPHIKAESVGSYMRRLENNGLVRAREKYDKKLKRNVILWELTSKGRKALR